MSDEQSSEQDSWLEGIGVSVLTFITSPDGLRVRVGDPTGWDIGTDPVADTQPSPTLPEGPAPGEIPTLRSPTGAEGGTGSEAAAEAGTEAGAEAGVEAGAEAGAEAAAEEAAAVTLRSAGTAAAEGGATAGAEAGLAGVVGSAAAVVGAGVAGYVVGDWLAKNTCAGDAATGVVSAVDGVVTGDGERSAILRASEWIDDALGGGD